MKRFLYLFFTFLMIWPILLAGWTLPSRGAADPTTWTAVDGLGRTLPDSKAAGTPRKDKYVGMFYWTWHDYFSVWTPRNITSILAEYPEAANDFSHPAWGNTDSGVPCFWNEPLYGYYSSKDPYVIRKHAELLADVGVDVIFFDCTNDTLLFLDACNVLFEVFTQAEKEGVRVPKIAFMLNINPLYMMENNRAELKTLYRSIYQKGQYQNLWFYWEGKPLVLSTAECLDPSVPIEKEILDFFTFRRSDDSFFTEDTAYSDSMWGWLSVYPQTKYGVREDGSVEQMCVGIAQNANEYGLTAMNDPRGGVHGRSYTEGPYSYSYLYRGQTVTADRNTADAVCYGLNFQQQWDYVLEVDPDFVFVTGWNEWIAGRWEKWINVENAFPDQYNDEYSRDIEPSAGKLKDHYYYQLAANIRRFKGVNETQLYTQQHTIDISGDPGQWDAVSAEFTHYTGSTRARDFRGYGACRYESDTMRNDIVRTKVAYDAENLYFMVETKDTLSPSSDPGWMRLLIDTVPASENSRDWEGFEFIVNRVSPNADTALLERSTGGWNWEPAGEVAYTVQDRVLQIAIPRRLLGMEETVNFHFKWSDNMQADGDILDFYQSGDVAPGGRFMYTFYTTEAVEEKPAAKTSFTLPWYAILSLCLAAAALCIAVVSRIFLFRKRK